MSNSSTTSFLDQIPKVDALTVVHYLQQNDALNFKYYTFFKKNRNDATVSDFSVEQKDSTSTLKASVCLGENYPQKCCTTTLVFNNKKQVINDIQCSDCTNFGCDHTLAILRWTQQISKEKHKNLLSSLKQPSKKVLVKSLFQTNINVSEIIKSQNDQDKSRETSISIEKQPPLLQFKRNRINEVVDQTSINAVTLTKSQNNRGKNSGISVPIKRQSPVLQFASNKNDEIIDLTKSTIKRKRINEYFQENKNSCKTIVNINSKKKQKTVQTARNNRRNVADLSLSQILSKCLSKGFHTAEEFVAFAKDELDISLCKIAEEKTRGQSKSSMWHKLRYGRITASKIYEVSRCNRANGSLVQTILGKAKYTSYSMQRGQDLEDDIFREVEKLGYQMRKCGFYLHPDYPYLGASPDGIGKDFILEIKCPNSPATFNNYLSKRGKITKKCKAQVLLQMMITGKSKGLFCVADPNFEYNKKIYTDWVDYDQDEMNEIIESAFLFWKNNIYPKLV